jgi:hypothetical protein
VNLEDLAVARMLAHVRAVDDELIAGHRFHHSSFREGSVSWDLTRSLCRNARALDRDAGEPPPPTPGNGHVMCGGWLPRTHTQTSRGRGLRALGSLLSHE